MPASSARPDRPDGPVPPDAVTDRVYRKVALRLVPLLFVCYAVSYLDRVNVGFARLQMDDELWFSDAVYGIGAGVFFLGYILFEVPSNIVLHRVGARRWIARIMVSWGLVSGLMALASSPATFYLLRFLLGVAEAGFIPGILLYLTYWFPAHRRGRITALFLTAIPVATIVGGPVSGWLMQVFDGLGGLRGWQWMFVVEAVPAVLLGLVVLRRLDDRVADARWLDDAEKAVVIREVTADDDAKSGAHASVRATLRSPVVWLLGAIYFAVALGIYTISFWLPTILSRSGVESTVVVGLLSAVPYLVAVVAMVWVAAHGDRTGERRWHTAVPCVLGGLGLVAVGLTESTTVPALLALTLAAAAVSAAQAAFWSLPAALLSGVGAAAGIALVNSIGNVAGAVSTSLVGVVANATGSTAAGLYLFGIVLVAGGALVLALERERVNGGPAR
ncbi:MFS transporter [Pseudonocardia sp. HH130630-07]|uniref:MFS transporter n=1 Tax=Pseudonocardia sp. HH130630-07 TaxID=1690815 RepID=UPI000814B909|nr:MFS transporter [Pseudonocardia sp. HH130630-07]ANY05660.1 MFS transporter [Pseudonocardia sp. HH130630-07]